MSRDPMSASSEPTTVFLTPGQAEPVFGLRAALLREGYKPEVYDPQKDTPETLSTTASAVFLVDASLDTSVDASANIEAAATL